MPMGVGMALSGVLRAAGDARRAMYVTLAGGIVTAFTDPLLIFGLGLGVYGAALGDGDLAARVPRRRLLGRRPHPQSRGDAASALPAA